MVGISCGCWYGLFWLLVVIWVWHDGLLVALFCWFPGVELVVYVGFFGVGLTAFGWFDLTVLIVVLVDSLGGCRWVYVDFLRALV